MKKMKLLVAGIAMVAFAATGCTSTRTASTDSGNNANTVQRADNQQTVKGAENTDANKQVIPMTKTTSNNK